MTERSSLSDLSSYVNVKGEQSVGRRGRAETTRLERMANRGEEAWQTLILLFERVCRFPMNLECAHAFTRFYWGTMADQESAFRHRRQKKVLGKMLKKVLIPFIYRNRVWCLVESLWPITLAEFVGPNEQFLTKFPRIYASHQWQTIINYYEEIRQELEALEALE